MPGGSAYLAHSMSTVNLRIAIACAWPAAWLACALVFAVPAHAGAEAAWRAVPARVPADSLPVVLRALEVRPAGGMRSGDAAFALGQFHYARGEYEQAAAAFLRAAARLDGDDHMAARYAYGLAALAMGSTANARSAFEDVERSRSPQRPLALLGEAQAWDAERRPEKAYEVLRRLLAGEAGEAGPAALERVIALATQARRGSEVSAARQRLLREYPRSIEAARARSAGTVAPPAAAGAGAGKLETGVPPARVPTP